MKSFYKQKFLRLRTKMLVAFTATILILGGCKKSEPTENLSDNQRNKSEQAFKEDIISKGFGFHESVKATNPIVFLNEDGTLYAKKEKSSGHVETTGATNPSTCDEVLNGNYDPTDCISVVGSIEYAKNKQMLSGV